MTKSPAYSAAQHKALSKIISLAQSHDLSIEAIKTALSDPSFLEGTKHTSKQKQGFLVSIMAYLGGTLIVAGLFLYTSLVWDDLGSFSRVLLSYGSGLTTFIISLVILKDEKIHRASAHLWTLAAGLQTTGLFVILQEYTEGDDEILGGVIVFGVMFTQYLATYLRYKRPTLAFLSYFFGLAFIGTLYEKLDINEPWMWFATGLSMFTFAYHVHMKGFKDISPIMFFTSVIAVVSSSYYYLGNTTYDILEIPILLAMLWLGAHIGSRSLVVISGAIFFMFLFKYYGFSYWPYPENENIFKATAMVTGISGMLTGLWLVGKPIGRFQPVWLFLGSLLMFSGAFGLVFEESYDIIYPVLPGFMLYVSLQLNSRTLLVTSILSLLGFIGYFTATYFADTVGWPLAIMAIGLTFIVFSLIGVKLSAKMKGEAGAKT